MHAIFVNIPFHKSSSPRQIKLPCFVPHSVFLTLLFVSISVGFFLHTQNALAEDNPSAKQTTKAPAKEITTETTKETTKEMIKVTTKNAAGVTTKETTTVTTKETTNEPAKEITKETVKETVIEPRWRSDDGGGNFLIANPGYFDVGGGVGHIIHTNPENRASTGFLLTLKAYPWGRWYAPRQKLTKDEVTKSIATDPGKATEVLTNYLNNSPELYKLANRNWYHRISIFYGRSFGNFDPSTIKGSLDAIGVEYDIVPEFAIMTGIAFYQVNLSNGGFDTKHHLIFGIQMNLNAFSVFRNLGN